MKLITLLFIYLFLNISDGRDTSTKELLPFEDLIVENALPVELIPSKQNKIEISGAGAQDVLISQSGNTLRIHTGFSSEFIRDDIQIKLFFHDLNRIQSKHKSKVFASDKLVFDELKLEAREAGIINFEVNCELLEVEVKTGAMISLSGIVQDQQIHVTTGSEYLAKSLKSDSCYARLGTGANAEVYCTQSLTVKAGLGANLCYKGGAKMVKSTFLGATVNKCN